MKTVIWKICAVASDYSISEDGLVYTFTLRDGVKFHNGSTVTCERFGKIFTGKSGWSFRRHTADLGTADDSESRYFR